MPTTYIASATRTNRFLGRCDHCIRPIGIENSETFADIMLVSCPDCGTRSCKLERLYGTVDRMSCDSRCEGAIGPMCVCSCGGVNHGNRFFQTGERLASAIAAYRATTERRRAAATQRAETRRANRAAQIAERTEAYRNDNADLLRALENYTGSNGFIISIRSQAIVFGRELSERQIESVTRVLRQDAEREAQIAARRAQEAATAIPAPLGAQTVEGIIVNVRDEETQYGTSYKMLVKCDGYKVWSTIPRDILSAASNIIRTSEMYGYENALKGRKVRFTATLELSRNNPDVSFAIAKRPRKAELIQEEVSVS